jgi:hypothetical protein
MQNFAEETLRKAVTTNIEMEIGVVVKYALRGIGLSIVDCIELACDLVHYVVIHVWEMQFVYTRAIRKVTSGELLTKQAMGKTFYYIQKICT